MDHISWDSPHCIGYTEKYIVDVDESIPEYLLTAANFPLDVSYNMSTWIQRQKTH